MGIVERMRDERWLAIPTMDVVVMVRTAADLIETQAREIERLREALWEIEMFTNGYGDVAGIVHKMAGDTRRAALAGDSHDQ